MRSTMWPMWLAIGGTALQLAGLGLLIYELGVVSARERDTRPWWRLLWETVRAKFGRPEATHDEPHVHISPTFVLTADGTVTPREPASDDPAEVWIAWLRDRVDYLQHRLEQTRADQTRAHGALERQISTSAAEFADLLATSEEKEAKRRRERALSANRQGWGTLLVIAGVVATGVAAALASAP